MTNKTSTEKQNKSDNETLIIPRDDLFRTPVWLQPLKKWVQSNISALTAILLACTALSIGYVVRQKPMSRPSAAITPSVFQLIPQTAAVTVGNTITGSVYLVPQGNEVLGVDLIFHYDTSHLRVTDVSPNPQSGFGRTTTSIDPFGGTVTITAIAYLDGQPQPAITSPRELAKFTVLGVDATNSAVMNIVYAPGSTTDSNITVRYGMGVSDALLAQPSPMIVTVASLTPTPTPSPIPSPTVTPRPTPTGTPQPTSTPRPTVTSIPPPTPTPPIITQIDTITILESKLSHVFWKFKKLTVVATDSLAPDAELTVTGYGTLKYSAKSNTYTGTFVTNQIPETITVTSSLGGTAMTYVSQ